MTDLLRQGERLTSFRSVWNVVISHLPQHEVTSGVDFVELFNCSDKILSVNGWTLANNLAQSGSLRERIDAQALILPGEYLAFTPDPTNILATYPDQAQAAFLIENDLPSLPNDAGNISLIAANGDVLDSFDYEEDFHSELLDDEDGVSLERINPKAPTQQAGNWFSAASRVGFATPTRINSQFRDAVMDPGGAEFFFLEEDTFSPNGDGFQDALRISYQTPGAGWNARLRIFDANGRLIKILRRVELLAGEGNFLWDGTTDEGLRARTGIYVILVERFEPSGGTENEKLVAVLVNE
ncbi:MAG: FlgD immunoglobulin-like domain containing protein [Bacteroidota bacterium]